MGREVRTLGQSIQGRKCRGICWSGMGVARILVDVPGKVRRWWGLWWDGHVHVPAHRTVARTRCARCRTGLFRRVGNTGVYWVAGRGVVDEFDFRGPVEGDGMTFGEAGDDRGW